MICHGQFGRWMWLWLACYVVLVCGVAWWLFAARRGALSESATPQAQSEWEAWREDVERQQSEPSPVRRRVPASPEPPAVVLMRDHFGVILAAAVVLSSVLYWALAWFVSGAWTEAETDKEKGRLGDKEIFGP